MDIVVRERARKSGAARNEQAESDSPESRPLSDADVTPRPVLDFTAGRAAVGKLLHALSARSREWWGVQARAALHRYTDEDDNYYRAHFAHMHGDAELLGFEDVRPAYVIGHLTAFNPEYFGRGWERVDRDLAPAWREVCGDSWSEVSTLARDAFRRASSVDYQLWRGTLADD